MYYAFSVEHSRLVECRDCGHMMLHPAPENRRPPDNDRSRFGKLNQAKARSHLELIGRCLGRHGGRLLQIGVGAGDLLAEAIELGYEVTGIEPSESVCARARERLGNRGRIVCGDIAGLTERSYYDVCLIDGALEQAPDPRAFLELVYDRIRTGGVVIVATPSLDSWSARLMRHRWTEFRTERLHYFSQETLHSLLFQSGLEPIAALPAEKHLSLEYIAVRLRKHAAPLVSFAARGLARLAPTAMRQSMFRLAPSGIVSVSVKVPQPARRKLSIIVPAYDEAATLEPVLQNVIQKELEGLDKEIVIVESNSTDGTREIVMKYANHPSVRVILEDRPRGKGHAVRTGLAHATGDFIMIQDGDQEYDIEDYDVLIEPLAAGRKAFVLGSRHGGRTWKVRQFKGKPFTGALLNFGHWCFKTIVNVVFRLKLDDPFTMYKLFRRDCIAGITFECNRFDFDYELLIKIVRKGYKPIEIPVNYRSRSFSEGKKVSVFRDPWTWIRAIAKYRSVPLDAIGGWRASLAPDVSEELPVVPETRPIDA